MDWKKCIRDASTAAGHILDDDVLEELSIHATYAYETARAEGCDRAEAEAHVEAQIEGWIEEASQLKRRPRRPSLIETPVDRVRRLSGLTKDFRYGLRVLWRHRGFAAVAICTMGLGIGVMTTLFSVAYGMLLKPLPWPESDRLVRLAETRRDATRRMPWTMTNAGYLPWRDQSSTIESLAAWQRKQATITGSGETERVSYAAVSASLFALLRTKTLIGTTFSAEDDAAPAQTHKVILSYGIWQQRFGGSPQVLGQSMNIDGTSHTIIGVMPRDFAFPDREARLWTPFYIPSVIDADGKGRSLAMFDAMARLKPGVTPVQAAAEATARARSGPDPGMAAMTVFGSNAPAEISAVPAVEAITGGIRRPIISMLIAVALLLVTAIANIGSLQLARANTRQREMAIRAAIGAGRRRITQQLLAESVLLAMGGGGIGLILALALHRLLPWIVPAGFPRLEDVALNWDVLLFATALVFLTAVILGVLPALYLRGMKLAEALAANGVASTSVRRVHRLRTVIMAGQVAIACTLLIGAGLLMRSFIGMMHADRGYDSTNVFTTRVSMPNFLFTPARRLELVDTLLERARLLPGVRRIAFATGLPLSGSENMTGFTMKSLRPPVGEEVKVSAVRSVVTDGYFAALGMRVVQGRGFDASDTATSKKVVIVSRTFARRYLSDKPIGDAISNFAQSSRVLFEVVGIVDDVVKRGLSDPVQPEIYSLDRQMTTATFNPDGGSLVLRTSGDPRALVDSITNLVRELDPSIALYSTLTMEDRLSSSLARPRLYAVLLAVFAGSALVISGVGLFAVLSYSVSQRTREIGVRTALGATRRDVMRLVLRQGLVIAAAGVVIGMCASFAAMRYLSSLLYGITSFDLLTFAIAFFTIAVIALAACIAPAFRASRIDPLTAMRL